MADRVSVSIRIGGEIPRRLVEVLANTIELERLSIDWDENPFDPAQLSLGRPLDLCAYEVAWGRLDDLEEFCVSQGLPFVRWSGAAPDPSGLSGSSSTAKATHVSLPRPKTTRW
jgi:hypothetical protein